MNLLKNKEIIFIFLIISFVMFVGYRGLEYNLPLDVLYIITSFVLLLFFWRYLFNLEPHQMIAAVFSLGIFGVIGYSLSRFLHNFPSFESLPNSSHALIILSFAYLGLLYVIEHKNDIPSLAKKKKEEDIYGGRQVLVDTSVLIDGRIAKIAETHFLTGTLIIPHFILKELQNIADSTDPLRREKGRRGLDILKVLQQKKEINIKFIENPVNEEKTVDSKLVVLGKKFGSQILTTDYNLNKVASIEGITVLNVNELANALKPILLPGEEMKVLIQKEGKEYDQGVGYLSDGTMVVVENGRHLMNRTVKTVVTSVLQTAAGQMIFTKLKDD